MALKSGTGHGGGDRGIGFDLVVHHRYAAGTADLSGHGNNGHRIPAGAPTADATVFDGNSTRVVVFPSASLSELGGVRVRATISVEELGDRRTIVEGYLAFSLSVEPDGALNGGVYTGMNWHVLVTPAGTVPLHRSLDVGFVYDGCDTSMLSIDGAVVATRYAPLGPVGGVEWPYGLNIGAFPDGNLRVFKGTIGEVWLWKLTR